MTSEEVTAKRRAERKQFKLDRAKAMAAAIAEAEAAFQQGRIVSTIYAPDGTRMIPSAATWKPKDGTQSDEDLSHVVEDEDGDDEEPIENVEHLQLTLQEAFFLLWNFDCLSVSNPANVSHLVLHQVTRPHFHVPMCWPVRTTPSHSHRYGTLFRTYIYFARRSHHLSIHLNNADSTIRSSSIMLSTTITGPWVGSSKAVSNFASIIYSISAVPPLRTQSESPTRRKVVGC